MDLWNGRTSATPWAVPCARLRIPTGTASSSWVKAPEKTYFDDKFHNMPDSERQNPGEFKTCYEQQIRYIEPYLSGRSVILDVGCGPRILYRRGPDTTLIGVDPSFESLAANSRCDVKICGSACDLPVATSAVDVLLCFYSVHHMTGRTKKECRVKVREAFNEFNRVLKPGGNLFVCEMSVRFVSGLFQELFWNLSKKILGAGLDQFFWRRRASDRSGAETFPGAQVRVVKPSVSPFTFLPPIFSKPWFKLPKFMFPVQPALYHWAKPSDLKVAHPAQAA